MMINQSYSFQIVFVFVSSYHGEEVELNDHIGKHGDGVKDVAFSVENLEGIIQVSNNRFL